MKTRVAWGDTDASGGIHFTAVFRWVEAAEMHLYRELDLLDRVLELPRRQLEAEYLVPLKFDDEVDVDMAIERLGRTSITYNWTIFRARESAIVGRHTVVRIGIEGRPEPLTEEMRRLLETRIRSGT